MIAGLILHKVVAILQVTLGVIPASKDIQDRQEINSVTGKPWNKA